MMSRTNPMSRSRFDVDLLARKAGATWINFAVVLTASSPLFVILGLELWKVCAVLNCFLYTTLFRRRCLGMMVVGSYMLEPAPVFYNVLYTAGFATVLYSVRFPFDLLLLVIGAQLVCIMLTGDTIHANLTGVKTMTREAYVELCKADARGYLERGDLRGAVAAMASDLGKWNDLRPPAELTVAGLELARAGDRRGVEAWVEGFA
jgi:hypothetical protein